MGHALAGAGDHQPHGHCHGVGGRYGTTTRAIAVLQNNSGALIAVEPDPSVWAIQEVGGNKANLFLFTNLIND